MRKEIIYSREDRDFAMYLDGVLVGFARDYHEAETTLDQLVYEILSRTAVETADIEADLAAESELSDALPASIADGEYTFERDEVQDAYALLLAHPDMRATVQWQNALRRGYDLLYESMFNIVVRGGKLRYGSKDGDKVYETTVKACSCMAGTRGRPCKHRAAVLIAATILSRSQVAVAA